MFYVVLAISQPCNAGPYRKQHGKQLNDIWDILIIFHICKFILLRKQTQNYGFGPIFTLNIHWNALIDSLYEQHAFCWMKATVYYEILLNAQIKCIKHICRRIFTCIKVNNAPLFRTLLLMRQMFDILISLLAFLKHWM